MIILIILYSGSTYHLLKEFVQYNYALNMQSSTSLRIVWPLVAFMSDSIVMWKKLHPSGRLVKINVQDIAPIECCKCIGQSVVHVVQAYM